MIYALLMGNSLESCKEDVKRMENILKEFHSVIEINYDCHPMEVMSKFIKKYSTYFDSDDILYIHYSGHGRVIGKRIKGKLEMISTWVSSDDRLTYSYQVDRILSNIKCRIILVSDSCHSGNFGNFYSGKSPYLFIGSSSVINTSTNYKFRRSHTKSGILVCLFEYAALFGDLNIIFQDMDVNKLEDMTFEFLQKHRLKIKPVIQLILN